MVIDTSAVIAILFCEADGPRLREAILSAAQRMMSTATLVEAGLVAVRADGEESAIDLDDLLDALAITFVPVDSAQANLAREGLLRFGKGRHPAKLNLGDSFAYALARRLDEPLLFKGDDFAQTDVKQVTWA